jgi:hypothetical protein
MSLISCVIDRWRVWVFVLAALAPPIAMAQNFTGYQATTLDAFIAEWNEITKEAGPGVSFSEPARSNSSPRCARRQNPAATRRCRVY